MSAAPLAAHAELVKLARLLEREPEELEGLLAAGPEDLRRVREQATDRLFDAHRDLLTRLAGVGRRLPDPLLATIAQNVFGALLCARIAGVFDTGHAVAVAERLEDGFLADVAVHLDPRRSAEIVGGIPAERIVAVARVLAEREEYVAMGRIVGQLPAPTLSACLAATDDADLLRIAFVLDDPACASRVADELTDERLEAIVATATAEDLWPEALSFLGYLPAKERRRFARLHAVQDPAALRAIVTVGSETGWWSYLLPLAAELPARSRRELARALDGLDPALLAEAEADPEAGNALRELRSTA